MTSKDVQLAVAEMVQELGNNLATPASDGAVLNGQLNSMPHSPVKDHQDPVFFFRQIFKLFPDGAICTDSGGQILMVNPALEELLDYTEEELQGKHLTYILPASDITSTKNTALLVSASTDRETSFEVNIRKKDNSEFPAEIRQSKVENETGKIICRFHLIHDVSTRKEIKDSLEWLEVKFKTIADFAYNWECWTNLDGSFKYISPSCERITGYKVDDFMTNPNLYYEIILPEDQPKWEAHHKDSQTNQGRRDLQFRITRRDGQIRWLEHCCQSVTDSNGNLLGYRSSNRDITRQKNFETELQLTLIELGQLKEKLEAETAILREEVKIFRGYEEIVGNSNALKYVLFKIEQIASTDTSALLLGETGTGKELFARAIHKTSIRSAKPLVTINCATLPANLIESELFGHEKGSFTNAHTRQIGRFELANKGTIFLDEIGELPLELQPKLLRVLQEGEFERLGGAKTFKVDVRVIAATNRDLEEDVQKGLFRKDLWYRLNVFPITAPPLRDRDGDVLQLVQHFMNRFSRKFGKKIKTIPQKTRDQLEDYSWPGNIRELENVIERAVINSSGPKLILAEDLNHVATEIETSLPTLEEVERNYILSVLKKTNWKVSGKNSAAEILGLKRSTLRARMDKYQIQKP